MLPFALRRLARPDVAHVMGFRDPVTTTVATWCRARGVPYVFEPVGMFRPRLRKVREAAVRRDARPRRRVGRAPGDRLLAARARRRRGLRRRSRPRAAARQRVSAAAPCRARPARGRRPARCSRRALRRSDRGGKGIEHLLAVAHRLPEVHVVLAGPDDRHGTMDAVRAAAAAPDGAGRIHVLPPTPGPPFDLFRRADGLRPGVRRRELRARRSRGGLGGHAGGRLRPDRRRGVVRRRRGARRPVGRTPPSTPSPACSTIRICAAGSPRAPSVRPPARPGTQPSTSSSRSTPRRSTADNACGDSPQALPIAALAPRPSGSPAAGDARATRRRFSMLGS